MITVHALVPVFNRLELTQRIIEDLRAQLGCDVRMVVIDDGSTDGTAQWLATQPDVRTLRGDGDLWWAGAVDMGLRRVLPQASEDDYVLLINNDTRIGPDFVATLVSVSRGYGGAAVGTALRDEALPHELISIGARMDVWQRRVSDVINELSGEEQRNPRPVYEVDALSGRGTLYPVRILRATGYMHPRLLPHYHADYELACRARRKGFKTVVSTEAALYTERKFGVHRRPGSRRQRLFGKGSPSNVLQHVFLWLLVGTPLQRATVIPRMLVDAFKRAIYRLLPRRVLYLIQVCRLLLRTPFSGEARARVLKRVIQQGSNSDAWHAYSAATLTEICGKDVLVVGCGDGTACSYFVRLGPRAVHGLESAPGIGSTYRHQRVGYIRARPEAMPICSRVYQLVFCLPAAESGLNLPVLLEEMARVTREGGLIYWMSEAKAYSPEELVAAAAGLQGIRRTSGVSACVS